MPDNAGIPIRNQLMTKTSLGRALPRLLILCLTGLALAGTAARGPDPVGPVDEITAAALPTEARETLALIKRGGPFPYRQDGKAFHNREQHLPARPSGYYREYTVPAPGARNRGPRRIVTGGSGEYYFTSNHYRSFRRIRE